MLGTCMLGWVTVQAIYHYLKIYQAQHQAPNSSFALDWSLSNMATWRPEDNLSAHI